MQHKERITLVSLMQQGHRQRFFVQLLRRSPSTISRELRRNTDTQGYIFRGTPDLSVHGQQALDSMAGLLNSRPRKTLGWDSPYQTFTHLMQAIRQREAATIQRFSISGAALRT